MIRILLALAAFSTSATALDITRDAEVVLLGEVHDNARHHLGQADLIRQIEPKAVVFEMLSPAHAAKLNAAPRLDMAEVAARIDWAKSNWPDFELYQPIFEALKELPAVGAAAPKADVRRAFSEGAAAAFGAGAAAFGLDRAVPEPQLTIRKDIQFAAHCEAMPLDMMGGMVEAQRFRDASFAKATLDALKTYGAPVVLIGGNGHARIDWGIPALIAIARPDVAVVSVGFVEAPTEANDPRFHHTIVTDPAKRGDPCDVFKS